MKSKIDLAKENGYTDDEILDFISKKDSTFRDKIFKAQDAGYKPEEIVEYIQTSKQPSKLKSFISAPIKGALKSAQKINPLQGHGPIPPKLAKRILNEILPTRPEHNVLERAGEIIPYAALGPEGLLEKGAQVVGGTLAGEAAKQLGGGETAQALAEGLGMGATGILKGLREAGGKFIRTQAQKQYEKLPSGLTKLKAIDKKNPQLGSLSKERQDFVIGKLNEEASQLAKKTIKEHLPIAEQIEKGVDFKDRFEKGFGEIQKTARRFNPDIDISNVTKFMREKIKPFSGISSKNLSSEAKKMINEASGFINRYPDKLDKLVTIYRQNNRKISRIYEKGKLTGIPKDELNFLLDFNKEIQKSFEKTLPKDSAWLKQFKETNKEFKDFVDASKVLVELKGFLSGVPTKAEVTKLATNPKSQKKLSLKMGEKGSKEIIQIADDLKKSIEAIKKIPKSQLSKFDAQFPIYYFIPFVGKVIGGAKTLQAIQKYGRYGYGYWLSTPARRKIYQEAVKAINNNDLARYKSIAVEAKKEIDKEKIKD